MLAYVFVLVVLLGLGNWQLARSEQKRVFLDIETQRSNSKSLDLSELLTENLTDLKYKTITLEGHYDQAHQFFLDNQISDAKAGYFVLTPFIIEGLNIAILVNRGWLPLNLDRTKLPEIGMVNLNQSISGRINSFPSVGMKLANVEIPTDNWPSVVQVVNTGILSKKLGYTLFQYQLELDPELPNGFKRVWLKSRIMSPEQHLAYAIQWFGLALTLTIIFLVLNTKKQ
ncbi:MAG: SURF1 family protein [Methylococcaceae bacterium]